MKKSRIAVIGAVAVLSFGLVGWGTVASSQEVMGVLATAKTTGIAVSDQPDRDRTVTIDLVRAPKDSFVVVHQNDGGMPGKRLGYTAIKRGTTRNVVVKLDADVPMTPELLAAVHVDAGVRGKLEFDMEKVDYSPDKPYFVDGKEVAVVFKAVEFGVPTQMGDAAIEVGDQPLGDTVTISKAIAPTDAFVVVHKATPEGMPGERVGYAPIKAGESTGVEVKLTEEFEKRTTLLAVIHADRGVAGTLEFDMEDPVESPDQPFFADGMEVAAAFDVGPFGVSVERGSIEATDQVGATTSLTIDRVVAPADGWIVVHKDADGSPGPRVGLKRVEAGTSTDVTVELDTEMLSEKVFVALHADNGNEEVFDFDMRDKLGSDDQPFFVDGEEVAIAIKVRSFGVPVEMMDASLQVVPQSINNATIQVARVVTPADAWVVVHLDNNGMPGKRVGLARVRAGESRLVAVQLDASMMFTDTLLVALHADRGEVDVFEFNTMDGVNSSDQPYFVGDMEVAVPLRLIR